MKNSIILLFVLLLSSCSGLKLKLENGSGETFKKVVIQVGKQTYNFENLKSGEKTTSIKVNGSFSIFPTEIITENDTIKAKGFCFVGEKFYESGKLQVTLTIKKSGNENFIQFKPNR